VSELASQASFVIVAAGRGERYVGPPKVLEPVAGRPVVWWSIAAAADSVSVGEIVVVSGAHTETGITEVIAGGGPWRCAVKQVMGGTRRQDSVLAGIQATDPAFPIVMIHDGARPLVTPNLIDACAREALAHGAAIVAAPVTDTIKRVNPDLTIVETIPRTDLWGAQTPQGFRREVIVPALAACDLDGTEYTDEALLCEGLSIPVRIVPSSSPNPKLTHRADKVVISQLLADRQLMSTETA